ncbi:hypothetical protein G6F19_011268 [Rhizopus arrhizus]|uniref:Reverse transcriptase domain-containing protein n=1 Tax=Rhizopus oryzae TaxID=64495 RepID=A0A9P6X0F8_RHIOR|nr:hypothetical protein G6F19_011268 [Rhizopus arrhizus]KAG1302482.1 hypothetical protein G6F64_010890 [Rhizopus arrhizus]
MTLNDLTGVPTFQRSQANTFISSVIDYIYAGTDIFHNLRDTQITRLHHTWSDHSILHISFTAGHSPTGPGLWRANPVYASHKILQEKIKDNVTRLIHNISNCKELSPEEKWDRIKLVTKKIIRNYGCSYVNWRKSTIRHLEKKRNRILRSKPPIAVRAQLIEPIDKLLGQLQQELVVISSLKAGVKWREQGEKSAGFFKRLHHRRTVQQQMMAVKILDQQQLLDHNGSEIPATRTSDPASMRENVRKYYQQLYTIDHVEDTEIDNYLSGINFNRTVTQNDNKVLVSPITFDELLQQVQRSPKHSSPGNDGLGYQYLKILFNIPILKKLILEVYNNALNKESTPSSWKDIRVRLLPKKGDLTDLKNWRPISLINCDAKIFTRVINSRLGVVANKIIQPSQTGFMKGRFIGDNGLLLHLIVQQAIFHKHTGIGLLLDQEKAYDRVNPQYLIRVLSAFGFQKQFIRCIQHLFFGNIVQVNVNGFFSPTINQNRGLRQGDPLSPILFNLALEPLLLSINQDAQMIGYKFTSTGLPHHVKTLAYADDICTILNNHSDYDRLQYHMSQYSNVSNAKFNQDKTEAFSLSGTPNESWKYLLHQQRITIYHTDRSPEPFRYLGFHIMYTTSQRRFLQDKLITTVKDQVQVYSQRQISLRGRATIMNTLILTKVWYCLRLLQPTQSFFNELRKIIYAFVWQSKRPLVSFEQLCMPIAQGGLGVLKPQVQHMILQIRHLRHIFNSSTTPSLVQSVIHHHLTLVAGNDNFPLISLFVPTLRKHNLHQPMSIFHAIYRAYDRFCFKPDFSVLSVPNLLHLPLGTMFISVPDSHWLHRHPQMLASNFFIYDAEVRRLRLRVRREYPFKPGLCHRLYKDVLIHRTIRLQPYLWPYILTNVPIIVDDSTADALSQQFRNLLLWNKFSSAKYRQLKDPSDYQTRINIPKFRLHLFWNANMLLQARTVWYRTLNLRLPTMKFLCNLQLADSAQCRLCRLCEDSIEHFLVFCPLKLTIWNSVLRTWYPELNLPSEALCHFLLSLVPPPTLPLAQLQRFLTVVSTSLWYIWYFYWQFVLQGVPFHANTIISKISSQVSVLTNQHPLLE